MAGNRNEKTFREGVKKMSGDELGIELKRLQDKYYTLKTQQVTEKVEDTSQFGQTKRNIARVKTEISLRSKKAAK